MIKKQFNTNIAIIAIIAISLFAAQNSNAQPVKWTNIYSTDNANFYDIQKSFDKQEGKWERKQRRALRKGQQITEHAGEEVYKRWERYMAPRVYPSGNILLPSTNFENYMEWLKNQPMTKSLSCGGNWTELGPIGSPTGPSPYSRTGAGRVNFVRFDPSNSDIMYVGAPDGGLWKSTTGGSSWTTNTDFLSVIGCSDLAINPNNSQVMYLATGDLEGNRRSLGVFKSIDGGATWNPTALSWTALDDMKISKLLMNPNDPLNMIVSTNSGTYRTTDGWVTFTQGTFPFGPPNLNDMEFRPGDADVIYAAGNQIFKSIDNGSVWTEVTIGLPTSDVERIALAVTDGDDSYVYALYAKASDQGYLGMYRSTDIGTTFTLRSSSPNLLGYEYDGLDSGGQGFYDLAVVASPTDPDLVTTGGVNHWQSADGGSTWTNLSVWNSGEIHADVHELIYLPNSSTVMFSCNDGGVFKSTDNGDNFIDISNNLAIAQVEGLGLSGSVETTIVSGEQDNGTNLKTGSSWANINGGDGGQCFIDYTDDNIIYIQYVNGAFSRSDDGGATNNPIVNGLPSGFDFYSPWLMDPINSNKLYVGGIPDLYTSSDNGDNWTALGTPNGSGTITAIAVAPSNPSVIYTVKYDAVSKSTNGGTSFTDITGSLPVNNASPVMITVSDTDPLKVWVVFSGYSANDKVFKTVNGGTTWTNVSAGLPNLPINTIVYKNGSTIDEVYIGADIGIYYMDNLMPWTSFFTSLPNVAVKDLEIFYPTGKLRAATYGRGIWESDLYSRPVADFAASTTSGDCPLLVDFTNASVSTGATSYEWTFENGSGTPITSTDENPTGILYNDAGSFLVQLQITDSCGTDTKVLSSYITVDCENGLDEIGNGSSFIVYPNPTTDFINIVGKGLNDNDYKVVITDVIGQTVFEGTFQMDNSLLEKQVSLKELPSAIYLVTISSSNSKQEFKINKQ